MPHDPVDPNVSFARLEESILEWWRADGIPGRAMSFREGAEEFVFYEGPPYANNPPGIHHVLARAYKDVYNRYQSAKGRYVPRKAGWDCHGLPVEVEVERRLGFAHKKDIADYGIGRFNDLCREAVTQYVGDLERLTERIAFWVDFDDAYYTMSNEYIESVWWSLAELHRRGLLYEGHKVVPYCPRCETPLSDHELGQPDVYQDVDDPGVTVGLALDGDEDGAALAVWTTTPWTLISNLAVAVHPDEPYAVAEVDGRRLVYAEARVPDGAPVLRRMRGADLVGRRYRPPFDFARATDRDAWRVLAAPGFVTTDEGTGLVHLAPAFGADDLDACRSAGIATFNPVDRAGCFDAQVPPYAGRFVKDADADIISDLRARGLLVSDERHVHAYPHCWRCRSPLLYYALTSWYVRTTEIKQRMLEENATVSWVPEHIRDGRFGNWLENNVDWSLSRFRFWGTPLPVWRCSAGHDTPVESLADLSARAGRDLSGLDLHRPHVDGVTFPCPTCGAESRRIEDVIDVWYDSGAMPFAQYGYPHRNAELFKARFPADFISEAIDQTRGWFYSLLAESVLLFDATPYRNVVCLELIVDEQGRKMSKSLGNVVDPGEVFERCGADAVRFFLLTSSPPGTVKRVSVEAVQKVVRSTFLPLWNVYRLYVLYANIDGFDPDEWDAVDVHYRPALDRWVLGELAEVIAEADEAYAAYDCTRAGRRIAEFVNDLSNWYVRRSRRRFWRAAQTDEEEVDKASAYFTLWTCLVDVAKLLSPLTPMLSEALYRNLVFNVNDRAPASVHLTDFPSAPPAQLDPSIETGMAVARTLASLGHNARSRAGVKVRQPLRRAVVLVPPEYADDVEPLFDLVAEELDVHEVEFAEDAGAIVKVTLKPNYPVAGPDLGKRVRELAVALDNLGDMTEEVAEQLEAGNEVTLAGGLTVGPEHVEIRREPAEGTAFSWQAPFGVSIDLELDDELRREGLARELVHALQGLRRELGLEVTDRVALTVDGPAAVREALEEHEDFVCDELLAESLDVSGGGDRTLTVDGHQVSVRMEKVD